MEDIKVISSNYVQGSYQLLPMCYDRVRASIYFSNKLSESAGSDINLSKWYYRAALSEFKSIFDLLPADLKNKGLSKIWNKSETKESIEKNPLIKILKKTRDLALHSGNLPGAHKEVQVTFIDESGDHEKSVHGLYFDKINRSMHEDMKHFKIEDIEWFNKQALQWPADLLLREGTYQMSIELSCFLAKYRKHITS